MSSGGGGIGTTLATTPGPSAQCFDQTTPELTRSGGSQPPTRVLQIRGGVRETHALRALTLSLTAVPISCPVAEVEGCSDRAADLRGRDVWGRRSTAGARSRTAVIAYPRQIAGFERGSLGVDISFATVRLNS